MRWGLEAQAQGGVKRRVGLRVLGGAELIASLDAPPPRTVVLRGGGGRKGRRRGMRRCREESGKMGKRKRRQGKREAEGGRGQAVVEWRRRE